MEKPVIFDLFNSPMLSAICKKRHYSTGQLAIHHFPDEEILVKINSAVKDNNVIFIASTDRPNNKIAPLFFAADTARQLGAKKIGLISPYLAYLRQDKQFHPNEGVTSQFFAKMISAHFDWLITIDPHLHRWHHLNKLFTIPAQTLHATLPIVQWIKENIPQPILIGPDKESQQWVAEIAKQVAAPFLIVEKQRFNDTTVESTVPHIEKYKNYTPVIADDIISTGETMLATIRHLKSMGISSIHCIGVHAIFANQAYEKLSAVAQVATCNTILHPSNKIDVSSIIIDVLNEHGIASIPQSSSQ